MKIIFKIAAWHQFEDTILFSFNRDTKYMSHVAWHRRGSWNFFLNHVVYRDKRQNYGPVFRFPSVVPHLSNNVAVNRRLFKAWLLVLRKKLKTNKLSLYTHYLPYFLYISRAAHSLPVADAPSHGTASHPPAGHPDALPLSNSPRKENQFVESPGKEPNV